MNPSVQKIFNQTFTEEDLESEEMLVTEEEQMEIANDQQNRRPATMSSSSSSITSPKVRMLISNIKKRGVSLTDGKLVDPVLLREAIDDVNSGRAEVESMMVSPAASSKPTSTISSTSEPFSYPKTRALLAKLKIKLDGEPIDLTTLRESIHEIREDGSKATAMVAGESESVIESETRSEEEEPDRASFDIHQDSHTEAFARRAEMIIRGGERASTSMGTSAVPLSVLTFCPNAGPADNKEDTSKGLRRATGPFNLRFKVKEEKEN